MQNPEQKEKEDQCMYHVTIYAFRENSEDVKCDRRATKLVTCALPRDKSARRLTYDEDLRLCWKHYRVVDYYRGAEGKRTKR